MHNTPSSVPPDAPLRVRPASFSQQRLWFLAQLAGANAAYNETLASFRIDGPLDREALLSAFDSLTDRHESLRTRLVAEDGTVNQHIDPPGKGFTLVFEDLSADADPDGRVARYQRDEAERPFDLEAGPLGRGRLIALGPRRHVLLLTFHHIIFDGTSMKVMMEEVAAHYTAALTGGKADLPELTVQYADYAQQQREAVLGGALASQEDFWRRTLDGAPPSWNFPPNGRARLNSATTADVSSSPSTPT